MITIGTAVSVERIPIGENVAAVPDLQRRTIFLGFPSTGRLIGYGLYVDESVEIVGAPNSRKMKIPNNYISLL